MVSTVSFSAMDPLARQPAGGNSLESMLNEINTGYFQVLAFIWSFKSEALFLSYFLLSFCVWFEGEGVHAFAHREVSFEEAWSDEHAGGGSLGAHGRWPVSLFLLGTAGFKGTPAGGIKT